MKFFPRKLENTEGLATLHTSLLLYLIIYYGIDVIINILRVPFIYIFFISFDFPFHFHNILSSYLSFLFAKGTIIEILLK